MKLNEPIPPEVILRWRRRIGVVSAVVVLVGLVLSRSDPGPGRVVAALGVLGLVLMYSNVWGQSVQSQSERGERTAAWAYWLLAAAIVAIVAMFLVAAL